MKTNKIFDRLALLMLVVIFTTIASVSLPTACRASIDSCLLQLPFPKLDDQTYFTDTVWIDTCSSNLSSYELTLADLQDTAVTNHLYRKRLYFFSFLQVAIPVSPFDEDSVHFFQITDIDSSLTGVRALFEHLDTLIGSFGLKKTWQSDSLDREYQLIFDAPVNSAFVDTTLAADTTIEYHRISPYSILLSVPSDPAFRPLDLTSAFQIQNSEVRDRTFHLLGYQWQMFKQKLPMAWEITKGRNNIYISFEDEWLDGVPSTWPDWNEKETKSDLGNFIRSGRSGDKVENGGLPFSGSFGGPSHGISTAGMAVALIDGQGMIGTCPGCVAVAGGIVNAWAFDSDVTEDDVVSLPAITSLSVIKQLSPRKTMESGIVIVSAAGNSARDNNPSCVPCGRPDGGLDDKPFVWARVYTESSSDPSLDFKPISVHATTDGAPVQTGTIHTYRGNEAFIADYNYSRGVNKFDINTDVESRTNAKIAAFSDIGAGTGETVSFVEDLQLESRIFRLNTKGTSQAAPQVSGIIGLMMSVDRYLGVDLNSAGMPANGADVQRSAHTIITFTADKIRDTCEYDPNDPNDGPCDYKTGEVSGAQLEDVFDYLVQPAYVEQTNDPLRRWWAQRMGFGRVNAYRAVAHSIPLKGAQTWTSSTTFFSGVSIPPENEDGIEMLMLGSYNSAGNPVLESGGEDLPGENYNNQGVTYINGTETTLTVPVNSLVAIDGLLKTTNATGNNKIITTTGTGEDISSKVLINGLLEDVEVVGNVHIGDLIIRGSSGDATGCIAIGSTANHVDLYGDVTLIDYGVLMLNRGSATFNVGSTLNLAGERDLKLKEGVSVTMDQASKITTSNGKRVIVESGSTLTVAGDIHAMIATDIIVKSGGSLIVEEDGVLAVNRFEVERDGEVILKQGARLELLSAERSIVYGRFDAQGTSGKPIRITGRLRGCATEYCELVDQAAMIEVIDDVVDLEDVSSCYLRLEHVIVKDVPFSMVNAPVYPIQNCTFTGKVSHFNDANVSTALIRYTTTAAELKQIRYNGETGATPLRLATNDCSFYQYEFGGTNSQEETGEVLSRELEGIVVVGVSDVSVEQCDFYSLRYGVQIEGVIHSSTLSSDFTKVDYGISTLDNSGSICQSNFTTVEAPISLAGTGTFSVTDNVIDDASVGVRTIQGGLKYFRNNEFFSYARFGVFIEDCIGRFDPVPSNIISNDYDIWGRNYFEFDPTSSSFTYDANPSDVRIESTGEASFECGQNEFSEKSTYHLSANPAKGTYDISNNEFNNPAPTSHLVRTFQVTTAGTPINTSARLSGCGNVGDDACKGTITGPCWVCPLHHAYFPDDTWFGLPPSSTVFDDAFDGSRSEMNADSISDDLRILKAHHAYQAALYGDSIVDKLSMLSGDLYAIFSDPLESGNLRSAIGLLTASSYTRLGNDTFALAILDTVRNGFGEWTDSIVASWRTSTLSAEIDSTISSPYRDSLMHYYGQQAIMDWRIIVGILGGYPKIQGQHDMANEHAASSVEYSGDYVRAQASPGSLAIQTQVHPGAWFSVSVYRADGERVRQLFSGPSSHERMEFSMSSEELPRGLYFVILEAGGIAHSCPVFIE